MRAPALRRGDAVCLVGLTKALRLMRRESRITNATSALSLGSAEVPRFRAVHEEVRLVSGFLLRSCVRVSTRGLYVMTIDFFTVSIEGARSLDPDVEFPVRNLRWPSVRIWPQQGWEWVVLADKYMLWMQDSTYLAKSSSESPS